MTLNPPRLTKLVIDCRWTTANGAALCKSSALARRSAAYVLKALGSETNEALGFAVSHAALAEEEASRAAFCAMVSAGLVAPAEVEPIFRQHPPRTYLFQREKVVEMTGTDEGPKLVRISKQPLTYELLSSLGKKVIPELREHDDDRNAGFYVGHQGGTWQPPGDGCSDDPVSLIYRYVHRADVMLLLAEALLGRGEVSLADNFRIKETVNGWECTPDGNSPA